MSIYILNFYLTIGTVFKIINQNKTIYKIIYRFYRFLRFFLHNFEKYFLF